MANPQFADKQTFLIPISNGIIEHREKIGAAVWLFILLIDWTTSEENGVGKVLGGKPIVIKDLVEVLRLKERQIGSQLQRLKKGGYIRLKRTPRGYSVDVMKSKKFINRERHKATALPKPDWQKIADHSQIDLQETADHDQQKIADHIRVTSNNVPGRPAENCRSNKDITVDLTNKREIEPISPSGKKSKSPRRAPASPPELQPIVSKVIAKMNELSGARFKEDTPGALKHLIARLRGGATEVECLAVVEHQWRVWGSKEEMIEHFDPVTLFRESNFSRYLAKAQRGNKGPGSIGFIYTPGEEMT